MTFDEIKTYCDRVTNKGGDSFYSAVEVYDYTNDACVQISEKIPCLQTVTESTTTTDTSMYTLAGNAFGILRAEFSGSKLQQITRRERDALELSDLSELDSGTPQYYIPYMSGDTYEVELYPVPNTAATLYVMSHDLATRVTTGASGACSVSIPSRWHYRVCNYVVAQMYYKDKDERAPSYFQRWEQMDMPAMQAEWYKFQRRDGFQVVKDQDNLPDTILGVV